MNNIWYVTSEFDNLVWYKRWIAFYLDNMLNILIKEQRINNIIIISKSHTKKKVYNIKNNIYIIPIYIKNKWIIWKFIFMFKLLFTLPKIINKYNIKIIETQETHTPLLIYNYLNFNKNINYILRLHTPEWFLAKNIERKKWIVNKIYSNVLVYLEKIFLKSCNKKKFTISSPSNALLKEIENFYKIKFNTKIIIPNFILNLKNKNIKKSSKKNFLYIWWLQIRKNTHILLDSIEKILLDNKNIEFNIIWKVWEKIISKKINNLKWFKWFNYLWELYWDEKYKILSESNYYIIPSRENYSMSMIEWALYKNYLITVNLWWNSEINKYNTLYEEWNLTSTLLKILSNNESLKEKIELQNAHINMLNENWKKLSKELIYKLLWNE